MTAFPDASSLEAAVRQAVAQARVSDLHTHLFPPSHGRLLLWGIDEVLTYHYLVAELFAAASRDLRPEDFWTLPKPRQADLVWEYLFLGRGALSESCRGVITTLSRLGLDAAGRNLASIREWFARQRIEEYLPRVFELAGLDYAVMTNNPFSPREAAFWKGPPTGQSGSSAPSCLKTALRIDTMVLDWPTAARTLVSEGYGAADAVLSPSACDAGRAFLADWARRLRPVYLAASLSDAFAYPCGDLSTAVLDRVVLPAAKELNLPVAMMIGVRRGVNPALGDAGDALGAANVRAVQHLCQNHPDVKFLVTMLSRVNQHELCVLARKFGNLHIFGCWWFCNTPSLIAEITRMRIELLGTAFTAQHSDARVLDQLLYKWAHSRAVIADVLAEKYRGLFTAGWRPTESEVRRDVRAIFGGSFEEFLAK